MRPARAHWRPLLPRQISPQLFRRTTHHARRKSIWSSISLSGMLRYWWVAGLALVTWRLALSTIALMRLLRGAQKVTDDGWWISLDDAATQLGVTSPVRLLESPRAHIPMTFGLRRAV